MTVRNLFFIWAGTAMLAAFASSPARHDRIDAEDPVVQSFERELAHEPPAARGITRSDIDSDPLYREINVALQTPEREQAEAGERRHD